MVLYNFNDLCFEIQEKYETVIDLIEKHTSEIWNYPVENQDDLNNISNYSTGVKCETEFAKLG